MSVKFIFDSACDLSKQQAEELGALFVSLKTKINGNEYADGVDITPHEFYRQLAVAKEMPTTSQVTPAEYIDAIKKALTEADEVVILTISGGLSGTVQSAKIAAADYEGKVFVVDSMNVTIGEQIMVEYAIQLQQKGLSGKEIADELERVKGRACVMGRLETLEFLQKGGRLSKTSSIVGTVLNIKPILALEDGVVISKAKARGAKAANVALMDLANQKGGIDFSMPYLLAYSGEEQTSLDEFIVQAGDFIPEEYPPERIRTLGSTIGTHVGPGAVVLAFFAKE